MVEPVTRLSASGGLARSPVRGFSFLGLNPPETDPTGQPVWFEDALTSRLQIVSLIY